MLILLQRQIPKIIQYPKLEATFGAFTPQNTHRSRRYLYFVRQCQEGIPLDESDEKTIAKMPEFVLLGCLSGKALVNLGLQLRDVSTFSYIYYVNFLRMAVKSQC